MRDDGVGSSAIDHPLRSFAVARVLAFTERIELAHIIRRQRKVRPAKRVEPLEEGTVEARVSSSAGCSTVEDFNER